MSYPRLFGYAITIDHTKVGSGGVVYFPMLLTGANLPAQIFGNYGAQSDGGDIMFTSDAAGATRLPCEIVTFTKASSTAEIWVQVPALLGSDQGSDTSIYLWWHYPNSTLEQPAVDAAYGRNAVHNENGSQYRRLVLHDPSDQVDSSGQNTGGNAPALTLGNGTADVAGQIGQALTMGSTTTLAVPNNANIAISGATSLSFSAWINANIAQTEGIIKRWNANQGWIVLGLAGAAIRFYRDASNCQFDTTFPTTNWHRLAIVFDASSGNATLYKDGDAGETKGVGGTTFTDPSQNIVIGNHGNAFLGSMDELVVDYGIARSAAWQTTAYNNESSPGTFATLGAAVAASLIVPTAANVRYGVDTGPAIGTLVVPGAASGSATLAKETGANARGGSGTCAKLTPTSAVTYGYWDFYVPVTAATAFTLSFYWKKSAAGFNGLLKVSIWDTDQSTLKNDAESVDITAADTDYHQFSATAVTPTATGFCRVRLEIIDGGTTGFLYIDDIVVA